MDIRAYYKRIRQAEATIPAEHVVVVSQDTADGGRGGIRTEVTRYTAARLTVEAKARLATEAESAQYYADSAELRRHAEEMEASSRVQVTLISDPELRSSKAGKATR